MPNILQPVTDHDTRELASAVHDLVAQNARVLKDRYFLGVLARYGADMSSAQAGIENAQEQHVAHKLGAYAVVNADNDIIGMATIYPGLGLRKLRAPIPPLFAVGPLKRDLADANNIINVAAWVTKAEERSLNSAYRSLVQAAGAFAVDEVSTVWAVEPDDVSPNVHAAIRNAGMLERKKARYDLQESRVHIPPVGVLYTTALSSALPEVA